MTVSYVSPALPASAHTPQVIASQLRERHELSPENDREATNMLLKLQAVANISGWKMDAEFARLREIVAKYQSLSQEIRDLAAADRE